MQRREVVVHCVRSSAARHAEHRLTLDLYWSSRWCLDPPHDGYVIHDGCTSDTAVTAVTSAWPRRGCGRWPESARRSGDCHQAVQRPGATRSAGLQHSRTVGTAGTGTASNVATHLYSVSRSHMRMPPLAQQLRTTPQQLAACRFDEQGKKSQGKQLLGYVEAIQKAAAEPPPPPPPPSPPPPPPPSPLPPPTPAPALMPYHGRRLDPPPRSEQLLQSSRLPPARQLPTVEQRAATDAQSERLRLWKAQLGVALRSGNHAAAVASTRALLGRSDDSSAASPVLLPRARALALFKLAQHLLAAARGAGASGVDATAQAAGAPAPAETPEATGEEAMVEAGQLLAEARVAVRHAVHHCTTAPLHHCTTAPLHHCTTAPLPAIV
eukprot:SAG11_NODE_5552_length_1527_cov_1.011204_1_plen_381_part_00